MRHTVHKQQKLVPIPDSHPHALELGEISDTLDAHPEMTDMVLADLIDGGIAPALGRGGMPAEQVLRAMIIKQINGFSYELLAFHLADSISYQAFCRVGFDQRLNAKTLQRNIKKVKPETLEAINGVLVMEAKSRGIERGRMVRTDCTAEETNIHEPSDSTLLFDVVRVLSRLMQKGKELGFDIDFVNHTRAAKRRSFEISNTRGKDKRKKLYQKLVKLTKEALDDAFYALPSFSSPPASIDAVGLALSIAIEKDIEEYLPLGRKVVEQTEARVFRDESVAASDKIVSIFEPHTDIIIKDRRGTVFGHKLCLTTGTSGLILDLVILDGNPADSTLAIEAVERQKALYGRVPRQISFDGGFASKTNLADIKELGVKDVAFHKKRGLNVSEMAKSSWVYKKLIRFRAGVEGGISYLKRCFGLSRCNWKGLESFKAYSWASVLSANLLMLARHSLAS